MFRSARIKDHYAEQQMFMRRAATAGALIVLAICILLARLINLQIVRYDYFLGLSQGNRIRNEPIPPNRGLILDRNGIALGLNRPSYQLALTREQVPDLDDTLQRLATLSLLERAELARIKKDILGRRAFETVAVKLQLSEDELARFAVRQQDFPGVEIQPRMARYYPLGPSAVHALGYVSAISVEDQKTIDIDEYAGTSLMGKSGVEKTYESDLHGKTGYQELLVNAQGRRQDPVGAKTSELKRIQPVAGKDLYLTIDQHVQQAAEQILRGRRGAAIAIDPNNGDVIAFVSTPSFDPNLFTGGISRTDYARLTGDPDIPLYNRALRGAYPPGSTVKPFMALAALQYGVLGANDTRYCGGKFRFPGRTFRDFKEDGHGHIDLRHAIEQSCDVYFYGVADILGIDRIHDFLAEFGFGKSVGLDIGGDRSGTLPSTEWKRTSFRTAEQRKWYPVDTISVGIGQGYLNVTPLQLASAVSAVAMRGKRFEPRLVRAMRDPVSNEIHVIPPHPAQPVTVKDASYWEAVVEGMEAVAKGSRGTARGAFATSQYDLAGKTGTAQAIGVSEHENIKAVTKTFNERTRDHAWFIAFAPLKEPRIAVAVIVENAGQGGSLAAPVARRIFDTYLLTPEALKEQDNKGRSPGITALANQGDGE